ncbi:MAG: Rne/Rng family ribonuclease [Phycisphaeraceae bacterium]|nr:Rne/Rng family ribonuclease [Phycisphaeraceae bacterium]
MAKCEMVINYVPGDECRVAVLEDGVLEEFHLERADAVSHVGNIYLGTVVNVEPAIQAAFVDFGLDSSGFLHVSDLHPRYFPGEDSETTEMVGKKTPRRERPPIQQCLRRGQEIAVQVLKEGVGTKGPTVTSYLSIPGRFLVMMPLMDKVGVSRKVEDEDTRRQMREILDQLDLPEGFGFILRTAGLERTKAELKRDLAYLLRLWRDMEKRWKQGARPRLLYSESDLLVRALRDMLSGEIDRIIIDNEAALNRAARFLKIVAPRSAANLVHYTGKTPVFHAMGVEPQIHTIHSREVPLKSGGRLVIDETEALVAIDVNSGKSREARDAETNAYETNLEAVDEICRQLRLRDVGGIIVNDLIDMRSAKHRRDVETRMKDNLKKDRARTTLAPISPFGILEMTRQRMRGSQESQHFADCPVCRGRGLVQKPDSVADDAIRELATVLQNSRVHRVEMVVAPRLAGELLSDKRHTLSRLERTAGKNVHVRVSEAIPVDRISFYAYDDRGADIDVARLPAPKANTEDLVPFVDTTQPGQDWAVDTEEEAKAVAASEAAEEPAAPEDTGPDFLSSDDSDSTDDITNPAELAGSPASKRRRRRRGRGGRDRAQDSEGQGRGEAQEQGSGQRRSGRSSNGDDRRSRPDADAPSRSSRGEEGEQPPAHADAAGESAPESDGEGGRRRRRRRRRRGGRGRGEQGGAENGQPAEGEATEAAPEASPDSSVHAHARGGTYEILGTPEGGAESEPPAAEPGGDDPESAEHPDTAEGGAPGEQGEGAGRRRRRRRRRGRGGRGGGGSGEGEGNGGGGNAGGQGEAPRPRQQQQQRREPDRPPAPPASAPPKPALPRTLYAFRRKLSPSERARIKPE